MAKKEERLLAKKLAKAEAKLRAADDHVAATRLAGEQAIQRTRLKAEKRLAKARREWAQRAEKVDRVERAAGKGTEASTPEEAALLVERIEQANDVREESVLVTPE